MKGWTICPSGTAGWDSPECVEPGRWPLLMTTISCSLGGHGCQVLPPLLHGLRPRFLFLAFVLFLVQVTACSRGNSGLLGPGP